MWFTFRVFRRFPETSTNLDGGIWFYDYMNRLEVKLVPTNAQGS